MDAMSVQLAQRSVDLLVLYIQVIRELCNYTIVLMYKKWDPGDWCSLQLFVRDLGVTVLSEWHELIKLPHMLRENGNHCSHNFGNAMLGLITKIYVVMECTSLCSTEVKTHMLPLPCNSVSPRLVVWSSLLQEENAETCIVQMGMNLHDHGYALYSS